MIKQVCQKVKQMVMENIKFFVVFFVLLFTLTYEFPYYIETPGGTVDVTNRIAVENGYSADGSFHLAYVSELKATIPTLLIAKLKKDWDIIKKSEVILANEKANEVYLRDRMQLEEANQNAILVAFHHANKEVTLENQQLFVTYIDTLAKTDLKIGDEIIQVFDTPVSSKRELGQVLKGYDVGETISFTVIRNQKKLEAKAEMILYQNVPIIGILLHEKLELETSPEVKFHFKSSESGPSGGLMMTLAIYNQLVKDDITKGKKIVGTGTIDEMGKVGEIAGVKYKLKGAEKGKADIFFVPKGKNYEEAIQLKKEYNYKIEIVGVSTFEEALEYLEKYVE